MKPFNILMLGDVVGQNALTYLEKKLWNLRRELDVSFAVVNGENVAVGNGIDPESARCLFHAGADVITTGNHVFRRKEVKSYLDDEPRLLRPANYPPACYGSGWYIADADGLRILVINLLGTVFMDPLASPFEVADKIFAENKGKYDLAVVDFHAEATAEKIALGHYLSDRAVAFAGTHTHVATADLTVLPNGCGYMTDLGMCGPVDSILGTDKNAVIERFTTMMPTRFSVATGPIEVQGVIFDVDDYSYKVKNLQRISF
jgi:metallophosphoesterase (TIGR00282 family)